MTIDNEAQVRTAYEHLTRLYRLCDRLAADKSGDAATRADEIESVKMMIRKIERQVAAYLAAHPEKAAS